MNKKFLSPLHETVTTTDTDYWNDSCSVEELEYAISHGAVGATTNPVIVNQVLEKEFHLWEKRLNEIINDNPVWSEERITWRLIEEMAVHGANLLHPVFLREQKLKGRLSIQTNPQNYRDAVAITEQAVYFSGLASNMQVKIPVTEAGIAAIEESTYQGVNINATVCFTVPQAIAAAEAVERGIARRKAEDKPVSEMSPVITIMVGRTDDWMQVLVKKDVININPCYVHWAGVAVFKKAYSIFQERGYTSRLLAAAYRHHLHWSELIGGDIVLTIPYEWQLQFNASDIPVIERIHKPVGEEIIDELYRLISDFRKAYDEDGLSIEEFDTYGASVRTLRGFISGYHDLMAIVRDFMLPNPDV